MKLFSHADRRMAAINKTYAVIEFDPTGQILHANENFLSAMGYQRHEVVGKHHRIFVDADYASSPEYADFWKTLAHGETLASEFRRFAKGGREIWIEASYSPVFNSKGEVERIIKLAVDITEKRLTRFDYESQIASINETRCVIEFDLQGHILRANQNFLDFMGYSEDELIGKHHRMFCLPDYAASQDYADFWARLGKGEAHAGEVHRQNKAGDEIWLLASYNPIRGLDGKPAKIVKLASDATDMVKKRVERETIQQSILDEIDVVSSHVRSSREQAAEAVHSSDDAAQNVTSVAAGAEELAASFVEINRSVTDTMHIAKNAVDQAAQTGEIIGSLSEAAGAIGQVVEMINSIADQTNLLALNATIEAARAGESGKGFAVVANEVKGLAGQTSQAIGDISDQISAVQTRTEDAVGAIGSISETIARIEEIATTVASAVEEQSAVTQDISASMQTASRSVSEVSSSVRHISDATEAVDRSADTMQSAAARLG
ncbi:MAG: PAS domain S-box protein [Alphaproteobacteria bacterium]|nr:PAS domain S-box protein [Alphaproteobacteria bacterium]